MPEKRVKLITGFRLIAIVTILTIFFRHDRIEVLLTAIAVMMLAIWFFPNLLAALCMTMFNIKEDYLGTLQYDDSDITDCKFKMIFDLDPEYLMHDAEILVKIEKADLHKRETNLSYNRKE